MPFVLCSLDKYNEEEGCRPELEGLDTIHVIAVVIIIAKMFH